DAAVMPLVIFFVPAPAVGVAEMTRVVAPGGLVAAYAWDMHGGGFPYAPLHEEMRDTGLTVLRPPSPDASRLADMAAFWRGAGGAAGGCTASTTFPTSVPPSISACASAARASGSSAVITGRTAPDSSSGQTRSRSAAAIAPFSSTVRGRSVEPVIVRRRVITS